MSSLLEEAIIDARALKETALKNAETTILEKYSAEVRTTLDALLEQELPLGEEASTEDEDLAEFAKDVPHAHENEAIGAPVDEVVEIDFDKLKASLEADETKAGAPIDALELADEVEAKMDDLQELDDSEVEGSHEADVASELDAGVVALEEAAADDMDEMHCTTEAEEMAEVDMDEIRVLSGDKAHQDEPVDEDIEITEENLMSMLEKLILDMGPKTAEGATPMNSSNSVEDENSAEIEKALAAHEDEQEEAKEEEEKTSSDVVEDLSESKIAELTESNKELLALISESKEQLKKLNLENAKLVYQNKALISTSLNERQKNQIVEAVQSANSVEEAKILFETIQNAVGSTPDQRTRPQTLREAVQRPTSLMINSKRNNKANKDPNMGRMLRLAGLTK